LLLALCEVPVEFTLDRRLDERQQRLAQEQADAHRRQEAEQRPNEPRAQLLDVVAERHACVGERVASTTADCEKVHGASPPVAHAPGSPTLRPSPPGPAPPAPTSRAERICTAE